MVIRLLTISTAHALPASVEIGEHRLGRRPALLVSPLVALVQTMHKWTSLRGWRRRKREVLAEVLQYSGAKWGDRDNDNVRSALASGLLWLMDALIISKQELQWFTYIKLVRAIIVRFRPESTCEEKIFKKPIFLKGNFRNVI